MIFFSLCMTYNRSPKGPEMPEMAELLNAAEQWVSQHSGYSLERNCVFKNNNNINMNYPRVTFDILLPIRFNDSLGLVNSISLSFQRSATAPETRETIFLGHNNRHYERNDFEQASYRGTHEEFQQVLPLFQAQLTKMFFPQIVSHVRSEILTALHNRICVLEETVGI